MAAQAAFWQAESPAPGAALTNPQSLRPADLKPYVVAAKRADEFLKLFPPPGSRRIEIADVVPDGRINERPKPKPRPAARAITDTRVPTALYYSAIAHSWLEEDGLALASLDRLLEEFPIYKRPQVPGYPEFKRPANFDLLRLKIYHLSRLSPLQPVPDYVAPYLLAPNALPTLQIAVNTARVSNLKRREWEKFVALNSPNDKPRDEIENIVFTPDARRATLVPAVESSLARLHNDLLPTAIQQEGALEVATYLQQFQKPKSMFAGLLGAPELNQGRQSLTMALKDQADASFNLNDGTRQVVSMLIYKQMAEVAVNLRCVATHSFAWASVWARWANTKGPSKPSENLSRSGMP